MDGLPALVGGDASEATMEDAAGPLRDGSFLPQLSRPSSTASLLSSAAAPATSSTEALPEVAKTPPRMQRQPAQKNLKKAVKLVASAKVVEKAAARAAAKAAKEAAAAKVAEEAAARAADEAVAMAVEKAAAAKAVAKAAADAKEAEAAAAARAAEEAATQAAAEEAATQAAAEEAAAQQAAQAAASKATREAAANAVETNAPSVTIKQPGARPSLNSSSSSSTALLATLGSVTALGALGARSARKTVEALLYDEAVELDELVVAHRRVIARRDHPAFFDILRQEDIALDQWFEDALLAFLRKKSAIRIAYAWRFRPWSEDGKQAFNEALAPARSGLLHQLIGVQELREDVQKQAFEFFSQVAPPLAARVKSLRNRLKGIETDSSGAGVISSTHHPKFATMRLCQEEVIAVERRLKVLEGKLIFFASEFEVKKISKAPDSRFRSPGEMALRLLQKRKEKQSPLGMSWGNMNHRVEKEVRTQFRTKQLLISSLGPVRQSANNALEELKALREEMRHVEQHQKKLRKIRSELAALRGAGQDAASASAPIHHPPALKRQSSSSSNLITELAQAELAQAEAAVKTIVLNKLSNGIVSNGMVEQARPHPAPSDAKAKAAKRGWDALRRAAATAHLQPVASPLWVCSPESGWHADHGIALATSLSPGTGANGPDVSVEGGTEGASVDVVALASKLSTKQLSRSGLAHKGTHAYRKRQPWSPTRSDIGEGLRPADRPKARTPAARAGSGFGATRLNRTAQSLPQLTYQRAESQAKQQRIPISGVWIRP